MIAVMMALITMKKLSPFTALLIVPLGFGLLAGYGTDVLKYGMEGILGVASTFAMMTFAILFFGLMIVAGMFDPVVQKVIAWCKGDPLKVIVGTSIIAAFVSLDGDGTTTVLIVCSALLPIYNRLGINKIYLVALISLQNVILNLLPWAGPTARAMAVMKIDAGEILAQLLPGMIISLVFVVGVSYYWGLKERKRLGVVDGGEHSVHIAEVSEEELALKRPKLMYINVILTAAVIITMIMGIAPSAIICAVGTAFALAINYPDLKTQKEVVGRLAPDMTNIVLMVIGAGMLMGVLNGPEEGGMSDAIAHLLVSMLPESAGRYFMFIIAFVSAPGVFLLSQDAFYFGVIPPFATAAEIYGYTDLQICFASLMGQAFRFISPLAPILYLLIDRAEITMTQYQAFLFKWCFCVFVIYMAVGYLLGYLPIL